MLLKPDSRVQTSSQGPEWFKVILEEGTTMSEEMQAFVATHLVRLQCLSALCAVLDCAGFVQAQPPPPPAGDIFLDVWP